MEDALDTALRGFCFGVTETKAFTGAAILWDNFMWVFKVLYSPKLFWPRWKTRVFVMTEPWCNLLYQYQRKNIHGLCKKNKLGASFGVVVVVVLFFGRFSNWCYYMLLSQVLWSTSHFNSGIKQSLLLEEGSLVDWRVSLQHGVKNHLGVTLFRQHLLAFLALCKKINET